MRALPLTAELYRRTKTQRRTQENTIIGAPSVQLDIVSNTTVQGGAGSKNETLYRPKSLRLEHEASYAVVHLNPPKFCYLLFSDF